MNIKKGLLTGLAALGLSMTASAGNVNVGGAIFDPNAPADFQSNGNIYETFAAQVGDQVVGFGIMNQFNGKDQNEFCPSCEITFTFSMDLVTGSPLGLPAPNDNLYFFEFDNVDFSFWVDNASNYDQDAPSYATAGDGELFLSAENHGLITGTASNLFDAFNISGNGNGFMDVTGGLAFEYFDTNTKMGGSDIQFNSSFLPAQLNVPGYPLFGSLDLAGDTTSVPEPSSIALLGLGILGFAASRKKKA